MEIKGEGLTSRHFFLDRLFGWWVQVTDDLGMMNEITPPFVLGKITYKNFFESDCPFFVTILKALIEL